MPKLRRVMFVSTDGRRAALLMAMISCNRSATWLLVKSQCTRRHPNKHIDTIISTSWFPNVANCCYESAAQDSWHATRTTSDQTRFAGCLLDQQWRSVAADAGDDNDSVVVMPREIQRCTRLCRLSYCSWAVNTGNNLWLIYSIDATYTHRPTKRGQRRRLGIICIQENCGDGDGDDDEINLNRLLSKK